MNELKPLMEEDQSNQLKPVEEPKIDNKINLPTLKDNSPKEDIISSLPEWSIEPPIEIKRGE